MEGSEIGVVGTVNRNYTSEIAEKVIHAVFNFIFGKGTFFPCYEWQGDRHRCLVLRAAERICGAQGKCLFGGPQILNSKKKYSASSRFTRKAGVVRSLIRTTTAECSQYGPTKHRQCNNQSIFTYFTFVGFPKAGPGTPPPPPPPGGPARVTGVLLPVSCIRTFERDHGSNFTGSDDIPYYSFCNDRTWLFNCSTMQQARLKELNREQKQ